MSALAFECIRCGAAQPAGNAITGCPACGDVRANLRVSYGQSVERRWQGVSACTSRGLWRYAAMLPVSGEDAISLCEGDTPLIPARRLGQRFCLESLFLKDETRNPTWSYKDRLSTVAVSSARRLGAKVLATASSGNAGASLAAYAARASLPCVVFTYAGTSGPMLAQIRKYGATVVPLANKHDRWPMLAECVRRFGWFATSPFAAPVIGSHPVGIEGYKTIAYEICADLDWRCPDWVVMPVCYGDALAGAWYGFKELQAAGVVDHLPKMVAVEVFGSLGAAIAQGTERVPNMPTPFATLAVSVGASQGSYQALQAIRQSGGEAITIGNEGLLAMQGMLAEHEGIFAELTAVMPLLAIEKLVKAGKIHAGDCVVGVVTASGLKDLDKSQQAQDAPEPVAGTLEAVLQFLSQRMNINSVNVA